MRVALFGGTFDPVHWGHLLLAESARTSYHLDRVIFVPTGIPPHKSPAAASVKDRLAMLRLAVASNPHFQISDWETRQNRVVYSYETIAHFRAQRPRDTLFFIVGTDLLRDIRLWKRGTELLNQCRFLIAERPGIPWNKLPAGLRRKTRPIAWPGVALASHEVREAVKRGRSIRYQVPDAVEAYIRKRRLYR